MIQDSTPNRQVFYDVSGLTTRMMQVDSSGTVTAVQPIYIAKLADASTIFYLENGANWNSGGAYIGPAVSSTYEDQYYRDASYYYRSYSDDDWTRLPRFSSAGGAGDVTKAYVDGSLALRDTSITWLNTNKASISYIDGSLAARDISINWVVDNMALDLWDISTNGTTVFLKDPSDNLEISVIEMKENGGIQAFINMPISNVSTGSEQSYDLRIDGSSALKIYGIGDGSVLSEIAVVINADYQYFGDPCTNGSWRIFIDASENLIFQKRISGVWTTSGYFSNP